MIIISKEEKSIFVVILFSNSVNCFPQRLVLNTLLFSNKQREIGPTNRGFLVAQLVKNPPTMQETPVQFLAWEDALEKG